MQVLGESFFSNLIQQNKSGNSSTYSPGCATLCAAKTALKTLKFKFRFQKMRVLVSAAIHIFRIAKN